MNRLRNTPYLASSLFFYVVLGLTDTLHHLHAAVVLGHENAIHAVWLGVVLLPIAVLSVVSFITYGKPILVWLFVAISSLAAFVPGFYHGGWNHLVKILGHLRIAGESTSINLLFPLDNVHLWIYEISGSLEFLFGVLTLYFLVKMYLENKRR